MSWWKKDTFDLDAVGSVSPHSRGKRHGHTKKEEEKEKRTKKKEKNRKIDRERVFSATTQLHTAFMPDESRTSLGEGAFSAGVQGDAGKKGPP